MCLWLKKKNRDKYVCLAGSGFENTEVSLTGRSFKDGTTLYKEIAFEGYAGAKLTEFVSSKFLAKITISNK